MVDGKAAHTLGLPAIDRLGLSVGATTLGREEIIAREEGFLGTYDRAVTMLAAKGRAAKDLERLLVRKGEPVEFARLAVEQLALEGVIDDEVFARSFVLSKSSGAGFARRRLQQELTRKGVQHTIADAAIADVFAKEEVDEVEVATALARKRVRAISTAGPLVQKRRLFAYLARRGYSPDVVDVVLARILSGRGSD